MVKNEAGHEDLEAEQFRKMFIGGLSSTTTDEALREYYSQWGELVDCIVMRDSSTKRSRGFGFVSYAKQAQVDLAMANRPHIIDGKTVDPKRAVPRDQSSRNEGNASSKRLYVSGVREEHTDEVFQDYFSQFGKVLKVEIIPDKSTGKPRGFAFVSFEDYDPVDKCVLLKSHFICNHRCDVKKALSKEEMSRDRDRTERMGRSRGGMRGGPIDRMHPSGGYSSWGGASGAPWGAGGGGRSQYYGGSYASGGSYGGGYGGSQGGGWNSSSVDGMNGWGSVPHGNGTGSTGPGMWNAGQDNWNQGGGQGWGAQSNGAQEWTGRY